MLFTLDAILALIVAMALIFASLFYISQANVSFKQDDLYDITLDSLAVLEKSGTFRRSIGSGTPDGLEQFLTSLPTYMCGAIEIQTKSSVILLTAIKPSCTFSEDFIVHRRVFIAGGQIYLARMEAWYK